MKSLARRLACPLAATAAVFLAARLCSAAEPYWHFYGSYDYFFPANSGEGMRSQLKSQSDLLLAGPNGALPYDSISYSLSSSGGTGTRLGALHRLDSRTEIGGSLGYVLGPTMNSDFRAYSAPVSLGGLGNGGQTVNRSVAYGRILLETRIHLLESRRWGMSLGSGWGLGLGHVDQSCSSSGSLDCTSGPTSSSKTWAGFAWEVGPVFIRHLKKIDMEFGARYAGFPRYKGSDNIASIRWESFGFFMGARL